MTNVEWLRTPGIGSVGRDSTDRAQARTERQRLLRPTNPTWDIGHGHISSATPEKIRPRNLAVPRPNLGVGVRHSLFPDRTRLGALAFAGGVLPDATLRGMRMFRSHGGTVLAVAGRDLLSEASSPSSDAPCRERRAGRGADTSAILTSRRHRYHWDGASLWLAVGPALRV